MKNAVIIVAAGRGVRAGSVTPKQYRQLAGKSVLARSIAVFAAHPGIDAVQTVIHADDADRYAEAVETASPKLLPPIIGGDNRQQSVLAGLEALEAAKPGQVLIHDAARPLLPLDVIDRVLQALSTAPACLAAMPLADTLKAETKGYAARTLDRAGLWRAQTPQGFHFEAILSAHRSARDDGLSAFTDDAAIAEWRGLPVALVLGSERNIKLTTAEDFDVAESLLRKDERGPREVRHGTGFDVHAFGDGDHVMLCGVKIGHDRALKGHSDADVGLHALTDAVLGAIGAGDIGDHFPPSDMRWKGAQSAQFLQHAAALVAGRDGRILHADVTLICERPKIGPHKEAMRRRMAEILRIAEHRVSVKATTTEGLGFTGRREGIAAMASATVELPGEPDDA